MLYGPANNNNNHSNNNNSIDVNTVVVAVAGENGAIRNIDTTASDQETRTELDARITFLEMGF